jgi:hypothetical protein
LEPCGVCWSPEEHASGYCRTAEVREERAREERRVEAEEVGWRVASRKACAFLVNLTFQKDLDDDERRAWRALACSPTAPAAGVSAAIDVAKARAWRSDLFWGRTSIDDDETVEEYVIRLLDRESDLRVEAEEQKAHETDEDRPGEPDRPSVGPEGGEILDGYYTVVFDEGEHRTIRIREVRNGNLAGRRIASYLAGPDNESDYVGFGFVEGRTVRLWKRFGDDSTLADAWRILVEDPDSAAKGYAVESGNCWRCNRTLTDPESIELGIGPVCRRTLGI